MKKLAILCVLACALVACDKPMNTKEEETASFSTRVDDPELLEYFKPDAWGKMEPIIYLVSDKTLERINEYNETWRELNNHGVRSWKGAPVDSSYIYTPYDLIDLFRTRKVSAIQEDYAYTANYQDIPYGEYALIHAFGFLHQDTLKLWSGFYTPITINEKIEGRLINMPFTWGMLGGWNECGSPL